MRTRVLCLLFVFSAMARVEVIPAQTHHGKQLPRLSLSTPQGMEGGFWRTDKNFDPILHLKNVHLKQPLEVTPTIFFADGTEFALAPVHLEPAGVASVNLKIALQDVPVAVRSHISEYGMIGVSYRWSWPAVIASIQDTDEIASLSNVSSALATISVVHKTPEEAAPQTIRGTWWKPTYGSDEVICLGNTSLGGKQVRVQVSDHSGNRLVEKQVALASHASVLLRLNDLLSEIKDPGDAGDIAILYTGAPHAVVASASIEDESVGYSVTPHLVERRSAKEEALHPVTLHAPGVMLGKADPSMLFPANTIFTPYAVLHNVSEHAISAGLSLTSDDPEGRSVTRLLDRIALAPGESIKTDMSRYFDATNPLPSGYGHLSVSFEGRNEDLLFDAGSADQSGTYVFQVMPAVEAPTINKIFCYWSVEGDTSSMISVWNYANKPQDATLTLYYSGGTYRIPIHLEARRTYNLDMMALVRSRRPDANGHLIPEYIKSGSATLVGPGGELDKMSVVVSASSYNVRNGTCWPICTNCGGIVSVSVGSYSVVPSQTTQATAVIEMASGSEDATTGTWSTGDSAIANVDGDGTVGGVARGSTSLAFDISAPSGVVQCYNSEAEMCADEDFEGDGTVSVVDATPVISEINPSTWNAGETTTVTFGGHNFGTDAPALTFSPSAGITYTIESGYSDTQIVADITVADSTPNEDVSVSVTNQGYGNQAFNGSSDGQSPQSSPATASVVVPVPNNLQLVNPTDEGDGFLSMQFTWASTTGKLSDLSACQVREHVTYPTTANSACPSPNSGQMCYWPPSPPWPPTSQPGTQYVNPTLGTPGPATAGGVNDNNTITNRNFVKPYSQNSFQAIQVHEYSCSGGPWTQFGSTYTITRQVTQQSSQWVFKISKTGISFSSVLALP